MFREALLHYKSDCPLWVGLFYKSIVVTFVGENHSSPLSVAKYNIWYILFLFFWEKGYLKMIWRDFEDSTFFSLWVWLNSCIFS